MIFLGGFGSVTSNEEDIRNTARTIAIYSDLKEDETSLLQCIALLTA